MSDGYGTGVITIFAIMGVIGITLAMGKSDAQNVSHDEARAFLNASTEFDTYTLGDKVACYSTKYDEGWGIRFNATPVVGEGSVDGIVCSRAVFVTHGENQKDDPLGVISDQESHMIPLSDMYWIAVPGN